MLITDPAPPPLGVTAFCIRVSFPFICRDVAEMFSWRENKRKSCKCDQSSKKNDRGGRNRTRLPLMFPARSVIGSTVSDVCTTCRISVRRYRGNGSVLKNSFIHSFLFCNCQFSNATATKYKCRIKYAVIKIYEIRLQIKKKTPVLCGIRSIP